jgi:hypothetical protein
MKSCLTLSACCLFLATAPIHASLIAFDPFESTTSSAAADPLNGLYLSNVDGNSGSLDSANNQNVAGGEIVGFGSQPWTATHTTFRVQSARLVTDSREELANGAVRVLAFRTSGGAASTVHRSVFRQLDAFTPSSTYFMSSAIQAFTAPTGNAPGGYLLHGFGNSAITDAATMSGASVSTFEGLLWGFRANDNGNRLDLVIRATTDSATNTVSDFTILEGITQQQTYFLVARVDVNPTGMDTVTVWLDPDFSLSQPAGGMSFSVDAFSSPGSISHFGMGLGGLLHTGGNNSTNRVGYIDGIALGTTYASVIPEPSTYALILGAGALGFLLVRRRRASVR